MYNDRDIFGRKQTHLRHERIERAPWEWDVKLKITKKTSLIVVMEKIAFGTQSYLTSLQSMTPEVPHH